MHVTLSSVSIGVVSLFILATSLCADQVEMQNGDRYYGRVLSVSADLVVLESDVLGRINLPRKNVANLAFGGPAAAKAATNVLQVSVPTNLPIVAPSGSLANTNIDLSAAFRNLGANTNFVRQIREQMLSATPEGAGKYDEMVNGLMSGMLNLNDVRREAKSSADQLWALKSELGPDVSDSLDVYLNVLDGFLKETAAQPTKATPVAQPKARVR